MTAWLAILFTARGGSQNRPCIRRSSAAWPPTVHDRTHRTSRLRSNLTYALSSMGHRCTQVEAQRPPCRRGSWAASSGWQAPREQPAPSMPPPPCLPPAAGHSCGGGTLSVSSFRHMAVPVPTVPPTLCPLRRWKGRPASVGFSKLDRAAHLRDSMPKPRHIGTQNERPTGLAAGLTWWAKCV